MIKSYCLFLVLLLTHTAFSQTPTEKRVTTHSQSWFSINSTIRFSKYWGAVGDFHVRRENFVANDFFYFVRAGVTYWIASKYPITVGGAHLWLAPTEGRETWSNENRIYQQWSANTGQGRASVLHRIRFEQRWRDVIVNDEKVGDKQFSVRLRYLASFDFRVFKDPKKPSLVASDEVLVQFGKNIVYNSFDQNRLFFGIKLPFNKKLSADMGYMNILQQRASGVDYDMSHVFRVFFYYNVDVSKKSDALRHHEESE